MTHAEISVIMLLKARRYGWSVTHCLSMAHTFSEKANRHWQEYSMATFL